MQKVAVCDFGDILSEAEDLGFDWNEAHEYLYDAGFYQGSLSLDHTRDGVYHAAEEHVEARLILKIFLQKHNLEEIYIKPKGG